MEQEQSIDEILGLQVCECTSFTRLFCYLWECNINISNLNLQNCFRGKFIWQMMPSKTYWHRRSQTRHFRLSLTSLTMVGLRDWSSRKTSSVIQAKLIFFFLGLTDNLSSLFKGKSKTAEGSEQADGSFSTSTSAQESDEPGLVDSASETGKMGQIYIVKQHRSF